MNSEIILSRIRNNREYVELLKEIKASAISKDYSPCVVGGLADSAKDFFTAAAAADLIAQNKNVLVLYPDDKEASIGASFLNSCGVDALRYPGKDFNFNNMTSSHEFENERISVLTSIAGVGKSKSFAVCASINAALQITMPLDKIIDLTITIDYSGEVDITVLAEELVAAGYKRVDLVEGAGQFTIRGGIIDIYATTGSAYRIELFGDEIDRMGTFDPITQRFIDFCNDEIIIPPAREIILDPPTRSVLKDTILKQLGNVKSIKDAMERKSVTDLLRKEYSDVENGIDLNFADKYLPIIYPDARSLLEVFDCCVIMNRPEDLINRADASYKLLAQSITEMLDRMELPAMMGMNDGYIKRWSTQVELFDKMPSILIDSIFRTYDGLTKGAEFDISTRHITPYGGRKDVFMEDIRGYVNKGYLTVVVCSFENERAELTKELVEMGITAASGENQPPIIDKGLVLTLQGNISAGFEMQSNKFALLDFSSDITGRQINRKVKKTAHKRIGESIMSYADLEVGNLIVHPDYGIGQYVGIENIKDPHCGYSRDYIKLKYDNGYYLNLPVDKIGVISKYIGTGSDSGKVKLSKIGGTEWQNAKKKAQKSTKEMAKELIELYAKRKKAKGIAFDPDDDMCLEFANTFEHEETEGQLSAIDDVRRDMEAPFPMDRLICGDVGYGKTEVALRAAFKAVMSGKQVAVLVPTTILASQHYRNFSRRMRTFPIRVDMLSRFRSPRENELALRRLKRGETDIVIGTHQLLANNVEFKDLGLVIIDEEQRFGVKQKEKLKSLSVGVDVLTLTATPIPRTLNMAMGGIVDMSLLDEAPGMRAPVQTYVLEYDNNIILEAIRRELRRNGQVFYLYNRVEDILDVAVRLEKSIPDARIAVAHGKMDKEELEDIWDSLVKGNTDILVCTTIIETGVDIPNANTLIIENADNYGLAQLHQIRGRVGRSGRRAYAYLTYRKNKQLTEISEKRLTAIKEYAQFGAGYKIALRDLEIRGAGNLLGAEQHGHMEAVGYDMYMKLLNEAVIEEKGEKIVKKPECVIDVNANAYLSKEYIPHAPQRIDLYKKIALIDNEQDYEDLIDELCDRFGEPGSAEINLCRISLSRALAAKSGISKIIESGDTIKMYFSDLNIEAVNMLNNNVKNADVVLHLGNEVFASVKVPSRIRNTDFILDLVSEYSSLVKEQ